MSVEILDLGALALTAVFFALLYYLHKKKHVDFGVRTILAVGLGLIVGLAFKGHHTYVAAVGTIYAHVVSAVVIPLLIFSIISSITNLGNSVRLKQIGLKTVFFLVLNTFIASLITLIAGVATNIGSGVQYELATDYTAKEVPTFVDTVISLFPQNLAAHWSNGEVVPIVVFCILVAVSYNKIAAKKPEEAAPFKKFIDAGDLVMGRVVSYVISFTPYAVLSLIARAVSRSSPADLIPLLSVLVLAYVLCGIQVFVVESALIKFVGKLSPVRFFKGIWPAATVAFTSQSSVGTIPVTVNQLTRKLGVNEDVAAFGASLGANLGMPGCAGIWPTLLAVFTIHLLGIEYTPVQYAFLVVLAVVVSIGTVGVPGTATITEGGASAPPLAYAQQLTVGGVMAYVDIPKINVYLPVQHGTDADTLERAVGHVVGTSLPVGGSSTHAVLSAHSGMASSKLFSDIDQLAEDDTFYIHVLGEVLAYKVDAINTVLPTDTSLLQIENGKDYVTLVTCTPFGVNTHRLLVRGHRIPYTPEQETTAAEEKPTASSWTQHYLTGLGIGLGAVAVVGGGYFLVRRCRHA